MKASPITIRIITRIRGIHLYHCLLAGAVGVAGVIAGAEVGVAGGTAVGMAAVGGITAAGMVVGTAEKRRGGWGKGWLRDLEVWGKRRPGY